jgi:hypothetical protein
MYCGKACQKAAYGALLSAGLLEDKANRPPCEGCGAPIAPERFVTARFCCKACHRRWRYRQTVAAHPVQTCEGCGAEFRPVRLDQGQRFCGHQCANTHGRRQAHPIDCKHCGTTIATPRRGQKFCNSRCQDRWHKAEKRRALG